MLVRTKQLSSKNMELESNQTVQKLAKKRSNLATFVHGSKTIAISPTSSVVDLRSVKNRKHLGNSLVTMEKQLDTIN